MASDFCWDVIAFDEVAGMHFKDMNAIQILKGYMAGGTYARGRESFQGDASLVFEGNINDSVQSVLKTTHLFARSPRSSMTIAPSSIASTAICLAGRCRRCAPTF